MRRRGVLFESTDGHRRFLVEPGQRVVIGRRPPLEPQHVRVAADTVSRQHARLVGDDHSCVVEDLGSVSGTFVDGLPVADGTRIAPGTALQLGGVTFTARSFEGERLAEVIGRAPLSIGEALALAGDVLRALAPLHDAGAAHGELTPDAVLRATDGRFTLLVQGSPTLGDANRPDEPPTYLAPEGGASPAGDVYALGLVVYTAISDVAPYPNDSAYQNLMAKRGGEPPAWDPALPRPLREWLGALLVAVPAWRPRAPRALALLAEVEAALG